MNLAITALLMLLVSITGALFLIKRNREIDHRATKVMAFVLYFWMISFLQVLIWGISDYLSA